MLNKIKRLLYNEKFILILLFTIGIIFYSFTVLKMSVPLFRYVDEELYISMAKSFFYKGNFSRFSQTLGYSSILYSMLISIAYNFYSPDKILVIMRIIGVISMTSVIFPAYMLANKALMSKRKAIFVSVISIMIPEMMYTSYLIQEVLFYPLFIWLCFFIYKDFLDEKKTKFIDIIICFSFYILYITKTYAIVFMFSYVLTLFLYAFLEKDKDYLKKAIISLIYFTIFYFVGKYLIFYINDFTKGTTHYSSQINSIFPITSASIYNILKGGVFYLFYLFICMGVLPLIIPVSNILKYEKEDRRYITFLTISLVAVIAEVVITIFLTENYMELYPLRMHYRYFFILFIAYFIMMLKIDYNKIRMNFITFILLSGLSIFLLIYFDGTNQFGKQSSIDSMLPYLLKILSNKYNGFNQLFIFMGIITILSLFYVYYIKKIGMVLKIYSILMPVILLCVLIVNYRIPSQVNRNGDCQQDQFIVLANYLNEKNDKILYLNTSKDSIDDVVFFSDYIKNDYSLINLRDINDNKIFVNDNNTSIIIASDSEYEISGANEINIGTSFFKLYQADKGTLLLLKKPVLMNAWDDHWVKNESYIDYQDGRDVLYVDLEISFFPIVDDGSIKAKLIDGTGIETNITFDGYAKNTQRIRVYRDDINTNFIVKLFSEGYAIPKELNISNDERELSFSINNIKVIQ